jgi:hypothetical protein
LDKDLSQHADAYDAMERVRVSDRGLSTSGVADATRATPRSRIPVQFLLRQSRTRCMSGRAGMSMTRNW